MDPNLIAILIYSLFALFILVVLPLLFIRAIIKRILRAFVRIITFIFK